MVVGKLSDQHFNVTIFSNPEDKVLKSRQTTGQICPLLLTTIKKTRQDNKTALSMQNCVQQFSKNPDICG